MSEDIATLGVKVEADGIEETKNKLDELTKAGEESENQAKKLETAHKNIGSTLKAGFPDIKNTGAALADVLKIDTSELSSASITVKTFFQLFTSPFTFISKMGAGFHELFSGFKGASSDIGAAKTALTETGKAADVATEAFSLNRTQIMELGHSGRAIVDMLMAGASPMRALAMESSRLAQVLGEGSGGGGIAGVFSRLITFFNPFTIAVTAAIVVVGAFVLAGKSYSDAMQRMQDASTGLARGAGVTAAGLEQVAEAAAKTGKISVSAARDTVVSFAEAQITNKQTLLELTSSMETYARTTGQKLPEATKELAKSLADPTEAANALEQQLGILTAAEMEQIRVLTESGQKEEAVSIISKALAKDMHDNGTEATGLSGILNNLGKGLENVWTWMGKAADATVNSTIAMSRWITQRGLVNLIADAPGFGLAGVAIPWLGSQKMDGEGKKGKMQDMGLYDANRRLNEVTIQSEKSNLTGVKEHDDLTASVQKYGDAIKLANQHHLEINDQVLHDYQAQKDTLKLISNEHGEALTIQERNHKIATLGVELEVAKSHHLKSQVATLETQRKLLQSAGTTMTDAERNLEAKDAGALASHAGGLNHTKKPKKDVVEGELQKLQAEVTGQDNLNKALLEGEGATLKAEAAKAALVALADKDATASQKSREETLQLDLALSKYVGTVNKTIAADEAKTKSQKTMLDAISNGSRSIYDYNRASAIELATAPLQAAFDVATGKRKDEIKEAMLRLTMAMNDQLDVAQRLALMQSNAANDNQIKMLELEGTLIGASNRERAIAIVQLQNKQYLEAHPGLKADDPDYIKNSEQNLKKASLSLDNTDKKDQHDFDIKKPLDDFSLLSDSIKNATGDFGKMFGIAGQGFADLSNIMLDYHTKYLQAQEEKIKINEKYGKDSVRATQEIDKVDKRSKQDQISQYGNLIHAAKGFFAEGTTGYKVMQAAESAYRIFQFAMTVQAMVQDVTHTASSVANSGTRAAASGIEAVAKAIASLPFPLNIVAGAATIAFLVGIGVKISGGGGGAATAPPKPVELYNGQTDSYGNPTSSQYSVLKPTAGGSVASANDNGVYASNSGSFHMGDTHININGDANADTINQMRQVLDAHKADTVQAARQAVAADNAANSRRQRIGGG
jgi:hypothetical protein